MRNGCACPFHSKKSGCRFHELYPKATAHDDLSGGLCAEFLSNAAQILHSLAETSTETHVDLPNPAALLRQALLYFKRCLTIQEYHLAEFTTQQDAISGGTSSQEPTLSGAPSQNGSATLSSDQVQEERWATIVEPVTNDSILDTILAQLETLTTFCSITTTEHAIAGISSLEDFANSLLTEKLPVYMAGTNRKFEVDLTCASFFAALANTKFFLQEIDFAVFTQAVHDAFASLDLTGNPEGLVAKAEALIAYNNAFSGGSAIKEINDARWKALTSALENLTSASKIPTAKNVAKLHILRGDVELYRFQLGSPPCSYDVATKNAGVLLKNAEKIYKGAELTARATGVENDMQEALTKVALVKSLQGDVEQIQALMGGNARKFGKPVLDEAVDEALVTVEQLAAIGIS